mgnify:CR=1 FL=1
MGKQDRPLLARDRHPFEVNDDRQTEAHVHRAADFRPSTLVKFLREIDALRRPHFLDQLIQIAECDARGRTGFEDRPYPQPETLYTALAAMKAVNQGDIARSCATKSQIPAKMYQAFISAVKGATK